MDMNIDESAFDAYVEEELRLKLEENRLNTFQRMLDKHIDQTISFGNDLGDGIYRLQLNAYETSFCFKGSLNEATCLFDSIKEHFEYHKMVTEEKIKIHQGKLKNLKCTLLEQSRNTSGDNANQTINTMNTDSRNLISFNPQALGILQSPIEEDTISSITCDTAPSTKEEVIKPDDRHVRCADSLAAMQTITMPKKIQAMVQSKQTDMAPENLNPQNPLSVLHLNNGETKTDASSQLIEQLKKLDIVPSESHSYGTQMPIPRNAHSMELQEEDIVPSQISESRSSGMLMPIPCELQSMEENIADGIESESEVEINNLQNY